MPNRIIKDSICTSDNLNLLTAEEEVFWYRLLVQCDDYGRMDARPAILRARCYPLRLDSVTEAMISAYLTALRKAGLISLYEVDGRPYLQIVTWDRHQQIRAKHSKYPAPGISTHMISDDIICNQTQSSDNACNQTPAYAPVIQSNPIINNDEDNSNASPSSISPEMRAIRNAYDACGLMLTKTHLDAHLEIIERCGLPAWQAGFTAALEAGKQNIPNYVARCAETAMIQAQRRSKQPSGRSKHGGITANRRDSEYHALHSDPDRLAQARAEWEAAKPAPMSKMSGDGVPGL